MMSLMRASTMKISTSTSILPESDVSIVLIPDLDIIVPFTLIGITTIHSTIRLHLISQFMLQIIRITEEVVGIAPGDLTEV